MTVSNTYAPAIIFTELGSGFADEVEAAMFPKLTPRFLNRRWAERVGLGDLTEDEWRRHFGLFAQLPGNLPKPLALRYHGHQFRSYNPDLGDGRGFLFAQLSDAKDGRILDLGTKGSGNTPYSRSGDGRLTLKGAVREVLATEMLEAFGVDTSKTFCVFETGESLMRNDEPSPTRAAVLTRLSHSHIRFGTFQRFAALDEREHLAKLVDYCLKHYPINGRDSIVGREPVAETRAERAAIFLRDTALRSARLCASWMIAGFVHGVLNTDNMNITGESFDYGPYRFLPKYDPTFTAAYFDHSGLYAYGRQPETVFWNLQQLAMALTSICSREALEGALDVYPAEFNRAVMACFNERLGVAGKGADQGELFASTFEFLDESGVGFDQFFHDWYGLRGLEGISLERSPAAAFYRGEKFETFRQRLRGFVPSEAAGRAIQNEDYFENPQPCSLLIDEIESIWQGIDRDDDWSAFDTKIAGIRAMGKAYGRGPA